MKRTILRWIHIIFGLPILGFIYGPPAEVEQYRAVFQYGIVPMLMLSGLAMWKGHILRRFLKRSALQDAAGNR